MAAEYDKIVEYKSNLERLGFSGDRSSAGDFVGVGIAGGDVIRILKGLKNANVTMEILKDTRIGHVVNDIKKQFPNTKEAEDAKALIRQWKDLVENSAPSSSSTSSSSSSSSKQSKSSSSVSKAAPAAGKSKKVQVDNVEKWSVAALQSYLRDNNAGVVTGTKGILVNRVKLFDKCVSQGLITDDGENPCQLSRPKLQIAAAKLGVNPMNEYDAILDEYVRLLAASGGGKRAGGGDEGASSSSSSSGGGSSDSVNPIAIARRVLELGEVDDYEGILNIATPPGVSRITSKTSVGLMRKAYLKLSLVIHPDKLGRSFDQATKAFQTLVTAFDRLSSPDYAMEEDSGRRGGSAAGKDVLKLSRSNDGCVRTRVCCPRCRQPWSEGSLDGNPDYFYNFMMMGLKQYSCSTCLCEFGCMTAIHKCPYCKHVFEYSPEDYHRKITCGREKCDKKFGFFMYNPSDRVINEMKLSVKTELENRIKAKEAKIRRAKRADSRGTGSIDQEKAFLMGLLDCCPRCGATFDSFPDYDQRIHLAECTDDNKQAAHRAKLAEAAKKNEAKEKKAQAQEDVQAVAAWQFLGSQGSQLWLLNEDQLKKQAEIMNIDIEGSGASADKDELISRIAAHKRTAEARGAGADKRLRLTDGHGSSSSSSSSSSSGGSYILGDDNNNSALTVVPKSSEAMIMHPGYAPVTIESLPSNMHTMSTEQLRSVCAANGVLHLVPKDAVQSDILEMLEGLLYGADTSAVAKKPSTSRKSKSSKSMNVDGDDGGDSDYQMEEDDD